MSVLAALLFAPGGSGLQALSADLAASPEEAEFRQIQEMRPRKGLMTSEEPLTKEEQHWNQDVAREALAIAERARRFNLDYPNSNHRKPVEGIEREELLLASQAGDEVARERLQPLLQAALKQPGLDEDERMALRWEEMQNSLAVKATQGQRAVASDTEKAMRALILEFPRRSEPYLLLLGLAEERRDTNLVQEVVVSQQAPDEAKRQATSLLRRYGLCNHPLEMHFTALEGQEVDLVKHRGKVTLIDFWATLCGPCVGELPNVKAAYDKFHNRGFEVVGISLDQDRSTLLRFVRARGLAWPQYFDGKGWQNQYAQDYGISSIPAMWLINQQGVVVDWDARNDLAGKVEKLLAGRP